MTPRRVVAPIERLMLVSRSTKGCLRRQIRMLMVEGQENLVVARAFSKVMNLIYGISIFEVLFLRPVRMHLCLNAF